MDSNDSRKGENPMRWEPVPRINEPHLNNHTSLQSKWRALQVNCRLYPSPFLSNLVCKIYASNISTRNLVIFLRLHSLSHLQDRILSLERDKCVRRRNDSVACVRVYPIRTPSSQSHSQCCVVLKGWLSRKYGPKVWNKLVLCTSKSFFTPLPSLQHWEDKRARKRKKDKREDRKSFKLRSYSSS